MYIKVRVVASAKKEQVEMKKESYYVVSVKEKAEGNRANTRVREIFSDLFSVPIGAVRIISGHHSPSKILSIDLV